MDKLWFRAVKDLDEGNFSSLSAALGGPEGFDRQIVDWYENGNFDEEPGMLAEALTCACMLGRTETARYLLDKGVDPLSGIKTGLNGFHYAASGGRLDVIKLLIERKVSMEIENMYGGTVLGQALWSAINEHTRNHAEIIEVLIEAGAGIEPETLDWWNAQNVPSAETKKRVAEAMQRRCGFEDPLRRAHATRHIGLEHEYGGRLDEAERHYDEALALYRKHSVSDDLDYANAVRYPAAIKDRLGKDEESIVLWEEAYDRYTGAGIVEGVAEAAARLALLYHRRGEIERSRQWIAKANEASEVSNDRATHKFIGEVNATIGG